MAKQTKISLFKEQDFKPETSLEKTTRIARKMVEDEAEQRQYQIDRLRTARLEKEANASLETSEAAARNKQQFKDDKTR